MRDIIKEEQIFNEVRSIVGELTDNESAKVQAEKARIFLEDLKLTNRELINVFDSGAGFVPNKMWSMTKVGIINRIVNECLSSFDID